MSETFRMPLRVVFYRDAGDRSVWVAHCLEFDLLGHGATQQDAIRVLGQAVAIQVAETQRSGNSANLFTPAPAEYQMMYARGRDIARGEFGLQVEDEAGGLEIGGLDAREYDDGHPAGDHRPLAVA